MNIGKVEKILPESVFTKISRSILVNRNFIENLDRKKRIITLCKDSEMFEFRVAGSMVKGI
jgi:DNA-binding LytR/AlgR family response regulator